MRTLAALTTDELRDTALAVVGQHGHLESAQIPQLVALALDSDTHDVGALGVQAGQWVKISAAQARFASRVRFALNKLADAGKIVKVGADHVRPDGYASGNTAHYYTLKAYEAAVQKYDAGQQAKIELHNRWNAIAQRLSDGPGVAMGRQHQLTVEHWEQLLNKAGW